MSGAGAGRGEGAHRRAGDVVAQEAARAFGDALRAGRASGVGAVIDDALGAGLSGTAVQSRVIAPAMRWIGSLWERRLLSVADEHLATALSYQALGRLYPGLLRRDARTERCVLVAAAHGEHHVLGLRMVADTLDGAGFDVRFFGPDVPADSLAAWIAEHHPAAVALGLTMPLGAPALARQLQAIRDADPDVGLLIGGCGIPPLLRDVPGLVYAADTETLVESLNHALAHPKPLQLPAAMLAGGVERRGAGGLQATHGIDTMEAQMVQATAAAVDVARIQARRAFAMERMAFHDPLTDLWNRRAFEDRYEELLTDEGKEPPAILMIDVDRFKHINDNFGHGPGDRTLIAVAHCIRSAVRPGDFPARWGGDEFCVLLPATTGTDAVLVGERIRSLVEEELTEPPVTVSVGVGATGDRDRRQATLDVDRALYDAKRRGRNTVAIVQGPPDARPHVPPARP